jgi:hypothetical protein
MDGVIMDGWSTQPYRRKVLESLLANSLLQEAKCFHGKGTGIPTQPNYCSMGSLLVTLPHRFSDKVTAGILIRTSGCDHCTAGLRH